MGAAAHGLGDEMWDWLFEPSAADHGEVPASSLTSSGLPGAAELGAAPVVDQANTMEFAMDEVAVVDWSRVLELLLEQPPVADLLAVYRAVGRPDITEGGIRAGNAAINGALYAERALAVTEYPRVKRDMPWTAAHMYDESGGVVDVAQAAAGYYRALWEKLTAATHPRPAVIAMHPEPGERGVPVHWLPARTEPGPRGGGATTRIVAVLSNALPYQPQAGRPTAPLPPIPPRAFELREERTKRVVPMLPGWPKAGPYGPDSGEHSMGLYPAGDLKPCTWYRVVVRAVLRDHAGASVRPRSWRFQTRAAGPVAPRGCLTGPQPGPGAGVPDVPTFGPLLQPAIDRLPGGVGGAPARPGSGHDHHAALAALGRTSSSTP